jgi:competence protein ComEC
MRDLRRVLWSAGASSHRENQPGMGTSPCLSGVKHLALQALAVFAMAGLIAAPALLAASAKRADDRLRVYFVDVEGGQSTLFITPSGQSLLIDTGWPGNNYRDADRIAAVAKQAGLSRIDYALITHFHDDHVGGVPQLVGRIP